jgi:hypothetical protein
MTLSSEQQTIVEVVPHPDWERQLALHQHYHSTLHVATQGSSSPSDYNTQSCSPNAIDT